MNNGRVGFQFSLKNVQQEISFDTRLNIREEFNFLRYSSVLGENSSSIAFLDAQSINVRDNLLIKDRTNLVSENTLGKFFEQTFLSQSFEVNNKNFLLTDIFKTTSEGELAPLYYKHDLTLYDFVSNVEILDGDFNPVNLDLYEYFDEEVKLGRPAKHLYTNLKSVYDPQTRTYEVFYVRFKNSTGGFVVDLLNPKPFYSEADFTTNAKSRAYKIIAGIFDTKVEIFFDSHNFSPTPPVIGNRYSIKITDDDRIHIVSPPELSSTEKWYLRINPGEFYRTTLSGVLRYHLPEYFNQLFNPTKPYKILVEKRAIVLDSRLVYTDLKPIANLGIDGFYVYLAVKDKSGRIKRALTDDPSPGVYITPEGNITDVYYEPGTIQSISEEDGFIRLTVDIPVDARVDITYRYVENFVEYRGITVNSTINPRVLNNRIVNYIIPDIDGSLSRAAYHLMVNENGEIIDSNESDKYINVLSTATGGTTTTLIDATLADEDIYSGFELEVLSGVNSGRKLQITSYNIVSRELTVASHFVAAIETGIQYRINKKYTSYNYQDSISGLTFNYIGWEETYLSDPFYYVLLSDTYCIQTIAPQNIGVIDTRVKGGGIKKDYFKKAIELQDEVQWYWDKGDWDGKSYPGMGAILVELPREILQEIGGPFSREQVRDITIKHMGEGSYPVIRYYDRSTSIVDFIPEDKRITLVWKDVGAGSYNIYMGLSPDNMTLYRSVAGIITELTVDELENNKIYYFKIHAVNGGIESLPSRPVFGTPYNPAQVPLNAVYGETNYAEGIYNDA